MLGNKFSKQETEILMKSFVFKDLSAEDMKPILKECRIQKYDAGQIIISEGDVGRGLHVILEGEAEVFLPRRTPDGALERPSEVNLARLQPGLCFGEYSLLDEKEVSASVKALTPVRTCYFSSYDFQEIAKVNDAVGKIMYRNLLDLLVRRLRRMDKELDIAFMIK